MLRLKNGQIHQKIKFSLTKSLKNNKKFPVVNPNSLRGYKITVFSLAGSILYKIPG